MTVPLYSGRFAAELIFFILSSSPPHAQPLFLPLTLKNFFAAFFPRNPARRLSGAIRQQGPDPREKKIRMATL